MDSVPNNQIPAATEPPPLPPPPTRPARHRARAIGLLIVLVLGMGVGVLFLLHEVAARRPGAAILLQFDLAPIATAQRAEVWERVQHTIGRRAGDLGGCRVSDAGPGQLRVRFAGRKAVEIAPAAAALTRRGQLEFRAVHPQFAGLAERPPAATVPPGYDVLSTQSQNQDTPGRPTRLYFAVRRGTEDGDTEIADAYPAMDQWGHYEIRVQFTEAGSRRFAELTGANVGRLLAIVLDGRLYSAPRVNERIAGGSAQITGTFTQREAIELSGILASPLPLPATFTLENEDGSLARQGATVEP